MRGFFLGAGSGAIRCTSTLKNGLNAGSGAIRCTSTRTERESMIVGKNVAMVLENA